MSRIGQRVLPTLTLRHGSHLYRLDIGHAHTPVLTHVTATTVISKTATASSAATTSHSWAKGSVIH
jgi:hypothetical protein